MKKLTLISGLLLVLIQPAFATEVPASTVEKGTVEIKEDIVFEKNDFESLPIEIDLTDRSGPGSSSTKNLRCVFLRQKTLPENRALKAKPVPLSIVSSKVVKMTESPTYFQYFRERKLRTCSYYKDRPGSTAVMYNLEGHQNVKNLLCSKFHYQHGSDGHYCAEVPNIEDLKKVKEFTFTPEFQETDASRANPGAPARPAPARGAASVKEK